MNLPNKITSARFFLTLVFIGFAAVPASVENHLVYWRICFILAFVTGFSDLLDGYLARKYNLITTFGKLMDPLADKVFTVSSFVVLTYYHVVPHYITILILMREFVVTGLRSIASDQGQVVAARWSGKIKTLLQMLTLALGGLMWVQWAPLPAAAPPWFRILWDGILIAIALGTVYTGIEYFYKGRKLYLRDA